MATTFAEMLNRFAIVTVMNAKVYKAEPTLNSDNKTYMTPAEFLAKVEAKEALCTLDTLKIANVTMEGPSKTVTGGQYSNPLVKFGKSCRLEMQDALGNKDAIQALCGGIVDTAGKVLSFGENFEGPKTIIGDTFFIDQKTGEQVKVKIIFYSFLPDSLFNLTQDAEGDATVFDMNGDLMTTLVKIDTSTTGVFYSIVESTETPAA